MLLLIGMLGPRQAQHRLLLVRILECLVVTTPTRHPRAPWPGHEEGDALALRSRNGRKSYHYRGSVGLDPRPRPLWLIENHVLIERA